MTLGVSTKPNIGQQRIVLGKELTVPCSGALLVLMAVIMVLNSWTRFGIACLIHS